MSRLFDSMVALERPAAGSTPAVRTSFRACVMEGGFDDPLGGPISSVDRRAVSVIVKRVGDCAWNRNENPKIGDVLTIDGTRFAIFNVRDFASREFVLEARQC